jgi:hypothetical protein
MKYWIRKAIGGLTLLAVFVMLFWMTVETIIIPVAVWLLVD